MKAKQETPFPILKERTRGEKTVLTLLAYLYGFLWRFNIKVLYVKLLTRPQVVYILIYQHSLQSTLLRCGEFYVTEGQNRSPEKLRNKGAKARSVTKTPEKCVESVHS